MDERPDERLIRHAGWTWEDAARYWFAAWCRMNEAAVGVIHEFSAYRREHEQRAEVPQEDLSAQIDVEQP